MEGIADYGEILVTPPDSAFEDLDIIKIVDQVPESWSVNFTLWTEKEGLSDLTLETTLTDNNEELLTVEVDGIHVL